MKIIDISMEIKEGMLVYPGNPKPKIRKYVSISRNRTNESTITIGSHTGTHVDAPRHVDTKGITSDKLPLISFYGNCRVFDLSDVGREIQKNHLKRYKIKQDEIILLKTENSKKQYRTFRKNFAHLNPNS